ncbi:PTS sugar transporter subunit IIC [Peptostreptococcus porci]|uniref:PTS transporter subunit IIC n=1 Tax=Peptostreptococcus porci TaxID=2652282 RepID=UPI002A841E01|nr:PTS sugar transporter subunit IIC [Peptostreptococcus porci]MDY4129075.1 PTS sugar transporter subunit IIC [Peptostreptococcus porci]
MKNTEKNDIENKIITEKSKSPALRKFFHRYFIQALNGMALGLFCTLIIGLIIKQIGISISGPISTFMITIATIAMSLTGAVIGIGVAHALESPKLVILASGVSGMVGAFGAAFNSGKLLNETGQFVISGAGDPLGAFIAVVIGAEIGRLVSGKTKIDIIVTPFVTIMVSSIVAFTLGPILMNAMTALGHFIMISTELQPFLMGIIVSVVMGIVLTLPISSAALSIILGLSGIASGAATIGCCCQMVGFAVISFKENGWNGLLAQGLGTSMLQVPNIMRKPVIWIPPIVASAILGPISTVVLKLENNPAGGGMGTSGLVGQLMTWQTMSSHSNNAILFLEIIVFHFVLPAVISLIVSKIMRNKGIINYGDYKLDL